MSSFLHDIATTLAARFLAMIGPFAVSIITARVLGPEDRGRYFLVIALAQISTQIANLGLQSSNTYLAANRRELVGPLLANSVLVACTFAPLVTILIALIFSWPEQLGLGPLVGTPLGPIAFWAVLLAPPMLLSIYINNLALAIGRVRLFNGLTIAYSIIAIAVALVILAVGGSVPLFLLGASISLIVPAVFGIVSVLAGRQMQFRFDSELFRNGFAFAARAYVAALLSALMARVGALALQHHGNIEEIGQFSVAVQLTDGLTMLPSTIGALLFPKLMQIGSDRRGPAMWRTFWSLGIVMLAILIVAGILAPWIVPLVFGQPFARAAILTQALLPSVLLLSLITVASQYLAAEGFPKIQVIAWLIGLLVQTALSYWLAGRWGGLGVSLAISASNALVLAVLLCGVFARTGGGR